MRNRNEGFTLVELVVSVALLAIILVPVAGFFTNSFKVQSSTAQKAAITRVGQYIIENIKNKNYLENELKNGEDTFKSFIEDIAVKEEDGEYSFTGKSETDIQNNRDWSINYNNADYNVDILIKDFDTSDISNVDLTGSADCIAKVKINSSGVFSDLTSVNGNIETYNMGSTFTDPIDGKNYTANYPTIILKDGFKGSAERATLWIISDGYYDSVNNKQKIVRIIKEFTDKVYVYKEGENNFSITMGQPGDGASASQVTCEELYIWGDEKTKEEQSELLLDAIMEITSVSDEKVRDSFEFSFSIDYDYTKETGEE